MTCTIEKIESTLSFKSKKPEKATENDELDMKIDEGREREIDQEECEREREIERENVKRIENRIEEDEMNEKELEDMIAEDLM